MKKLGPEVYDLVTLNCKGTKLTCFILEHIPDICEDKDIHTTFLNSLDEVLKEDIIQIAHGSYKQSSDFSAPSCNGNLYLKKQATNIRRFSIIQLPK